MSGNANNNVTVNVHAPPGSVHDASPIPSFQLHQLTQSPLRALFWPLTVIFALTTVNLLIGIVVVSLLLNSRVGFESITTSSVASSITSTLLGNPGGGGP